MSNTPETDAESCYPDSNLGECVCADFARKLERERDEAQADCLEQARLLGMGSEREARLISERDDALSQIAQAECRAERFCQERDEARNDIVGWENKWKCAVDMAARAEIERDDALNKLNDLKDILR